MAHLERDEVANATYPEAQSAVDRSPHPDPITGEPGSHPVGTGVGAAGAGAIGAVIGAVAGPLGALAGAAIGSVIGGLAGKGVAEAMDPTGAAEGFRGVHSTSPYAEPDYDFDRDYKPAYRLGVEARNKHHDTVKVYDDPDTAFGAVEPQLRAGWEASRGESRLPWEKARQATRDAFDRVGDRLASAGAASAHIGGIGSSAPADITARADRSYDPQPSGASYGGSTGQSPTAGFAEGAAAYNSGVASAASPATGLGITPADVAGTPSLSGGQPATSGIASGSTAPSLGSQFATGNAAPGGSSSPSTSAAFDDEYYRSAFATRPYHSPESRYDDYAPAYRYAHDSHARHAGRAFDEVETDLSRDWERNRGASGLT